MPGLSTQEMRRRKKILVVEDQQALRRLIVLTLRRQYEVREVQDAGEALAAIDAELPDALILDVMMPGEMDGFRLCEHIKRSPQLNGIHVIMVTARGQAHDIAIGKAMGADAYFVKPFSPLALVNHLEHALGAQEEPR